MFIAHSGATSHMVNSEENTTNIKDAKTELAIGYCKTLTEKNVVTGMAGRNVT